MEKKAIYDLFYEKVKEAPNSIALIDEKRSLTRQELDYLINTIAERLPKSARKIGIVMDHSVEMIAAILAVLKTGAAYIPSEPSFPEERIHFMMEDAGADCIITNKAYAQKLQKFPLVIIEQGMPIEEIEIPSSALPDDLAYILYTSGSTGKPKGVSVLNRNVVHYVKAFENEFKPKEQDIILQYSVCSFDIFVEEVFSALTTGMGLAIPSLKTKEDIHKLMDFVSKNNVSIISGFPYLLSELNHLDSLPESLRLLISGGDILRANYVANLIDKIEIYNTYGPSETTVCASYFRCNNYTPLIDGTYPIGKAVKGTEIKLLDRNLEEVPKGEIGEICILGNGVSAGYFGDREKENEAFIINKDGSLMYRSGDLGYQLEDGNIAFLHRKDTQVMIQGKRVEPSEVESIICSYPQVQDAVVSSYTDQNEGVHLVAYIVWEEENFLDLRNKLMRFLPDYMIPESFISLESLPLTANGKVDLKALPKVK